MRFRALPAVVAFLLLAHSGAQGQTGLFRVADLKPGMKGVGRTCFRGGVPEEFQVEILGVMRGVGPGTSAVLARLSGASLEHTGVFEGMSGSPVYIDNRLLGAVAFSFPFAKEAVAGITPIEQMIEAFVEAPAPPTEGPKVILKKSALWRHLRPQQADRVPGDSFLAPLVENLASAAFGGGVGLAPIATPVYFTGFSPETLRPVESRFRSMGFSVLQGTGALRRPESDQKTDGKALEHCHPPGTRRSGHFCGRNRHPHRRRQAVRFRPSALQSRVQRPADPQGAHHHGAPQPAEFVRGPGGLRSRGRLEAGSGRRNIRHPRADGRHGPHARADNHQPRRQEDPQL